MNLIGLFFVIGFMWWIFIDSVVSCGFVLLILKISCFLLDIIYIILVLGLVIFVVRFMGR